MFKFLTPRMRTLLGVAVIVMAVVLAIFFAPRYSSDSDNATGDLPGTPTVVVTQLIESKDVQHDIVLDGVNISIKRVMLASEFSDDANNRKRNSPYTVRVMVDATNPGSNVAGVKYPDEIHLLLPNGDVIHSRLISVKAVLSPKQTQSGFIDFPVNNRIALSDLKLRLNDGKIVPFGAS